MGLNKPFTKDDDGLFTSYLPNLKQGGKMQMSQILFDGESYELIDNKDGSKTLFKEKNRYGFKITINVSGDTKEHEKGIEAVKNFFVKGSNL